MMDSMCLLCREPVPVNDEDMEWAEEKRVEIAETDQSAEVGAAVLCFGCTEKIESGEIGREEIELAIEAIGGVVNWTTEYKIEKKYRQ
jgi:hypothetical protein